MYPAVYLWRCWLLLLYDFLSLASATLRFISEGVEYNMTTPVCSLTSSCLRFTSEGVDYNTTTSVGSLTNCCQGFTSEGVDYHMTTSVCSLGLTSEGYLCLLLNKTVAGDLRGQLPYLGSSFTKTYFLSELTLWTHDPPISRTRSSLPF